MTTLMTRGARALIMRCNTWRGKKGTMTRFRLRTATIGTGAALVLVAGATAAGAAIAGSPIDSGGVIHGCYTTQALNGSHVFVLQDTGISCPKGTTAISWNEQGQQGPAGPAGPAGSDGAQGPAGPAGPSTAGPAGLDTTVATAAGTGIVGAACPADHPYVTGGGVLTAQNGAPISWSAPGQESPQ